MHDIELCDTVLLWPYDSAAAGFDFEGGSYVGIFTENTTSAVISIPIVADQNSEGGTEYFLVQLRSLITDDLVVSTGNIREAIVYIEDEIIISFPKKNDRGKEGENLTLTVTASAASNRDFTITVNITGNDANMSCKLMVT